MRIIFSNDDSIKGLLFVWGPGFFRAKALAGAAQGFVQNRETRDVVLQKTRSTQI